MRSVVTSIFLYVCGPWTLTGELENKTQVFEMRAAEASQKNLHYNIGAPRVKVCRIKQKADLRNRNNYISLATRRFTYC